MNFDQLVDRLTSLYDVGQPRAVDVANERLKRLCVESAFIRSIRTLGSTVTSQTSYALDPTIAKILRAQVVYTSGTVIYDGDVTIEELWQVDAGIAVADPCAAMVVIEPDADTLGTTDNFRLYPTPGETGKSVSGLVVVRPATLTYGGASTLPIPENTHEHLLAGCKAELADEEGRQDDSAKFEAVFGAGATILTREVNKRGKGSGRHRIKVRGYDFARRH